MHRRRFVQGLVSGSVSAGVAGMWTPAAHAQSATARPLIGVLSPLSATTAEPNIQALREGLRDLGYVEGRNVALDFRFAEGLIDRLPALAAELVALKPTVIVVGSLPAIIAASKATKAIPIVMAAIVQDPIVAGLAVSMSRPGGNVTGFWSEGDGGLMGKRLELLKDAMPGMSRVGVLLSPSQTDDYKDVIAAVPDAARTLGLELPVIDIAAPADFEKAFARAQHEKVQALYVSQMPLFFAFRARIAEMATKARLPTISGYSEYASAGGLLSYAANLPDIYRRAAAVVDKIIKGSLPGDLPIERPVAFELVVNQKTAKTIGVTIPEAFLLRADRVIE